VDGEHIRLPDDQLLLVQCELVLPLQQVLRPWRHFWVLRDHADPLPVGEDGLPQL